MNKNEESVVDCLFKDDLVTRRECLESAMKKFNEKERYLLQYRLSERCICARFAVYLEAEVRERIAKEYVADVEYNKGMEKNSFLQKKFHGRKIYPDLIVHKRGFDPTYGYDNMICIEMKMQEDRRGLESDKERLMGLTYMGIGGEGFCYRSGYLIIVYKLPRGLEIESEYVNGKIIEKRENERGE